jgi:hypothetical protein
MEECDNSGGTQDCNEGRFRLWGLLDWHTWRWDSHEQFPHFHKMRVTERCTICDEKRTRLTADYNYLKVRT